MATAEITKTNEKKGLEEVLSLWVSESKVGTKYFTGSSKRGEKLVAFYNSKKKNPKEPDVRIYTKDVENKISKDEYLSLWCNVSSKGTKYLLGTFEGRKVIAFINNSDNVKRPYLSVYYQEVNTDAVRESNPVQQTLPVEDEEYLPF